MTRPTSTMMTATFRLFRSPMRINLRISSDAQNGGTRSDPAICFSCVAGF
jgi:hypothetical protein